MKVMTAMYTMRKGGSYDRFVMMIEAFLERGVEVHCLSLTPINIKHPYFCNHKLYYPFKETDVLLAKMIFFSLSPPWALWISWRNRIDLFVAFGLLYAFIQGLSKCFLNRPMVTFIRGNLTLGTQMQTSAKCLLYLIKIIENIGLRFSDRIITNNLATQGEISRRLGKNKRVDIQVLYNNIPAMNIREKEDTLQTRDRYRIPGDAKILMTVGILNPNKNIEFLINCLPQIGIKNLFLLIVGDSVTEGDIRYKESLKELAKRLEVEKQVIFIGWLEKEDLWKIYIASDLFVMSSLNEGMPNAMLEALGLGVPCIGSNIPGVKDILHYEELLFDPLVEQILINKIRQFFSDKYYLSKIIQLCMERKKIFIFDWKEKVYEMVVGYLYPMRDEKIKRS